MKRPRMRIILCSRLRKVGHDRRESPGAYEGLASRQVGHRKNPLRAVEERVAEQLSKSDMPDDVPDRHVDVDLRVPLWYVEPHRLLFDLRPERADVFVVELVEDIPPNQG